jgi:hypothetical protein
MTMPTASSLCPSPHETSNDPILGEHWVTGRISTGNRRLLQTRACGTQDISWKTCSPTSSTLQPAGSQKSKNVNNVRLSLELSDVSRDVELLGNAGSSAAAGNMIAVLLSSWK